VSIDEAPGIQALQRIALDLPMRPGRVERREFEYKRHGTQTQGGFKRSSQHLDRGGCGEHSKAAFGSVRAKCVAVARPAHGGTA
jgi:hypothetical protein